LLVLHLDILLSTKVSCLKGEVQLHEAAMCAARPGSPDHAYYLQVRTRLGGKRAALSVARKLAREAYHTLRTLGDQALAPVVLQPAA
jgi:hypothetical protein